MAWGTKFLEKKITRFFHINTIFFFFGHYTVCTYRPPLAELDKVILKVPIVD